MSEQQACTLCGAGGHTAAQCKWGETAKLVFVNGKPAKCGCQVEYSSGGGEYSDVIYVSPCRQHSGRALDLVAENRIALTPEYEGQWHADLYLDHERPLATAEAETPMAAILEAINAERTHPEQDEQPDPCGEFRQHLKECAAEVETWPAHKRNALGELPEQAEGAQGDLHPDLKRIYDVIGLHYSQPVHILVTCFENTKRFSDLLHAVEREFFMVPGEPSDEPEDEGCEPDDVCLVRCWGSTQEQYIEQFRDALTTLQARAALVQPSPAQELERPATFSVPSCENSYGFGYVDGTCIQSLRGYRDHLESIVDSLPEGDLMTTAQHDRIVMALRADLENSREAARNYRERRDYWQSEAQTAQARVAELEACGAPALFAAADYFAERAKGPSPGWVTLSAVAKELRVRAEKAPVAQAGQVPELDQLYSMLGVEDQVGAAKKIAELVGCQMSRTALTKAQMRRLYENSTEAENERLSFAAFARLMRRAEAVHQIAAASAQGGSAHE